MAENGLQITAKTAAAAGVAEAPAGLPKVRGRPFQKGRSGNPAGRGRGQGEGGARHSIRLGVT
jgi:hypothetical protein